LFSINLEIFYFDGGTPHPAKVSVPIGLVNVMGTQSELLELENVTLATLNSALFLNPSSNVPIIPQSLVDYVTDLRE
jgi:hypothetical protein